MDKATALRLVGALRIADKEWLEPQATRDGFWVGRNGFSELHYDGKTLTFVVAPIGFPYLAEPTKQDREQAASRFEARKARLGGARLDIAKLRSQKNKWFLLLCIDFADVTDKDFVAAIAKARKLGVAWRK